MFANKKSYLIGIDVGVNTGIAVYDLKAKRLVELKTLKIHRAMELVKQYASGHDVRIRIEDPTQVRFKTDQFKAQGAGSVKRDFTIFRDFMLDYDIKFEPVRPQKALTKWSKERFVRLTGYSGSNSVHARDAAMLVWGM